MISSPKLDVLAISVKGDSSSRLELTLDPVSCLPLKQTTISLANPDHPTTSETRSAKWIAFGGVKFPNKFPFSMKAGNLPRSTRNRPE